MKTELNFFIGVCDGKKFWLQTNAGYDKVFVTIGLPAARLPRW